ncbi:MAG TPA: hypothetical protein PLK30_21580 [Blastocatellia bacterium]|nr:hypothetical protein [Blastocatellia bacterium]
MKQTNASNVILVLVIVGLSVWAVAVNWNVGVSAAMQTDLFTDLGTLGLLDSKAYGINAAGQIVGVSSDLSGKKHAFLWDGSMRDLGVLPNTTESFAYAINDAGQVTGVSMSLGSLSPRAFLWQNSSMTDIGGFTPRAINKTGDVVGAMTTKRYNVDWFERACLWRNGALTDLGTLAGNYSYAYGINDAGQVAGISFTANDANSRAFLWNNGAISDLGTLGGTNSQAYAISNGRYIVGYANATGETQHAVLYTLGTAGGANTSTDLGTLSAPYSYAYAVNSKAQVVGTSGQAFLWQNGAMFDLNMLLPPNSGWILEAASAINEKGQIAGWGKQQGLTRAFLISRVSATPVSSVSAASYGNTLAAESIGAAFGDQLATTTQISGSVPLPTSLAGTSVIVRDSKGVDRLAPLFFVSPNQINFQMPAGTASGKAAFAVISGGNVVSLGTTTIAAVAPAMFTANANGSGLAAAQVYRVKANGAPSYEPVTRIDATTGQVIAVPIDLGAADDQVFLLLYGTGLRARSAVNAVTVSIGGVSAEVSYAGPQGDYVGLDQINARIPRNLAGRGNVTITVTVDGSAANAVTANIK